MESPWAWCRQHLSWALRSCHLHLKNRWLNNRAAFLNGKPSKMLYFWGGQHKLVICLFPLAPKQQCRPVPIVQCHHHQLCWHQGGAVLQAAVEVLESADRNAKMTMWWLQFAHFLQALAYCNNCCLLIVHVIDNTRRKSWEQHFIIDVVLSWWWCWKVSRRMQNK
jgi:hypothetical protein